MRKIIGTIILILLLGCGQDGVDREVVEGIPVIINPENGLWQNNSTPPISFELEQIFGKETDPNEMLVNIGYVFTDNNRNVYIFDRAENHLLKFDYKGKFLWTKGREGKGPGEFESVRGAVFDGNKSIYISNFSGLQIDHFDMKGNYLDSYKLSELKIDRVSLDGFIKPNILVVTSIKMGVFGLDVILLEIDENILRLKRKFEVVEDIGIQFPAWMGTGMEINVTSNEICMAKTRNYEFRYYNIDGKLIKKVSRNIDKLVRPGIRKTDKSVSLRTYSTLFAPMRLTDQYVISFSNWPVNLDDPDGYIRRSFEGSYFPLKYHNMLDLLNSEGELLYSIYGESEFSEIGRPIHVDKDGRLYTTIYDPFPQVRRYKVIIEE